VDGRMPPRGGHSIAFAVKYAGGNLRVVYEQLVERANQRAKRLVAHYTGDVRRALAAHNSRFVPRAVDPPQ
jgi:hypothetical protein